MKSKIIVFLSILSVCSVGLFMKDKLESEDNVYVLTQENKDVKDKDEDSKEVISKESKKDESNTSNKKITVYISGEVSKPGIVTLNSGDRLAKAIEKVGGTTKKADLNAINMAVKLEDEMHYIIPKIGQVVKNDDNAKSDNKSYKSSETNNEKTSKININTATIEELDKLPGVGEATANKIVNHRSENGEFNTIEEIKNVNGIGDKKFEDMKNLICVK